MGFWYNTAMDPSEFGKLYRQAKDMAGMTVALQQDASGSRLHRASLQDTRGKIKEIKGKGLSADQSLALKSIVYRVIL
jgi:hypothetical protein